MKRCNCERCEPITFAFLWTDAVRVRDHEVEVEHCSECGDPAHASETDDDGRCAECSLD